MMHAEIIGGVPLHNLHMEVLTTGTTRIPFTHQEGNIIHPIGMLESLRDARAKSTLRAKRLREQSLLARDAHTMLTKRALEPFPCKGLR